MCIKTNYKIDRIEVMVDKSNHFISETQMKSLINALKMSIFIGVSVINLLDFIGQFIHAIFTIGKIFSMINKIKSWAVLMNTQSS
jgi:hypothetical protein